MTCDIRNIQWQSRRFYPDMYGGLERVGYEVVKAWRDAGYNVSVITENYPKKTLISDEPIRGISCLRIPTAGLGIFWRLAPFARVTRWTMHQKQGANAAELVVTTAPECVLASKLAYPGRTVIYNCESVSSNISASNLRTKISLQQIIIEKLAAKLANFITTPSQIVKLQLLNFVKVPERKITIVPHGIDPKRFENVQPDPKIEALREQGYFLLIYLGRLTAEKSVDLAVDALAKMKHREKTRLIIVGEGHEEQSLRKQVADMHLKENVIFTGKSKHPERYLSAASTLILPSQYEAFGIVLLEAMASGIPSVAWRTEFPKALVASSEIIIDGKTGFCANPFDTNDLAKHLDILAEDPALRTKMGEQAKEECNEKYSWFRTAKLYTDLIEMA